MAAKKQDLIDRCFKDTNGNVVLAQSPNIPLAAWVVCKILGYLTSGVLHNGLGQLATATLFVWAYLEVSTGVNYFRRLLGVIVLAAIVWSFFK